MKIYLIGISCVGKSSVGALLAEKIGYRFYDLDYEIEKYFNKPLERIQQESFLMYGYLDRTNIVLDKLFKEEGNAVISGSGSSLRMPRLGVYKRYKKSADIVSIHLIDTPENILKRITFYDIDSVREDKVLNDAEKIYYLKNIKKSYTYCKNSLWRADLQTHIGDLPLESIPVLISEELDQYIAGNRVKRSLCGSCWYRKHFVHKGG